MHRILNGHHKYDAQVRRARPELFRALATGQQPEALIITCADSRVCPTVVTQAALGTLLVLRNAGNIIPCCGAHTSGEGATVELALHGLQLQHIIVMGHTQCAAVRGALRPHEVAHMPQLAQWVAQAAPIAERIDGAADPSAQTLSDTAWRRAAEANVWLQLEHLRTYPVVQERLAARSLTLHAWLFVIETGEILSSTGPGKPFTPLIPQPTSTQPSMSA